MKRQLLVLLLLPLLFLTGCFRQSSPSESDLYRHYAEQQDLKVAQLSGFKLCDTVRVDVVMLQADNRQAWLRLTEEFDIRAEEGTVSWLGQIDNPAQRTQWSGAPVMRVIASPGRRTVGFYRIDTEVQYDALIDYQLENTKNNN